MAEEQTRLLHDRLASKDDIALVQKDMEASEGRLDAKIERLDTKFTGHFRLLYIMLVLIIAATVIPFIRSFFG